MYTRIFLFLLLLTFYSCRSISRIRYEAAQSAGTVESYQQFIRDNPKSRFLEDAEDKLYKTAYVKAVEENTAKAYDDYIRKYPESSYLEDLIEKKEDTLIAEVFKEAQEENTLQGYIDFVTKYPEHDLAKEDSDDFVGFVGFDCSCFCLLRMLFVASLARSCSGYLVTKSI